MILGVVLPYGAYNAPWTSHDLFMIDVGAVTHAQDVAIKVIHLAVYVVIAFSLHLNEPGWWVVLDSSVNVLNVPAFYSVKVRNSNCSEEIAWLFSGIITSYDLRWVARGQVPSEVGKKFGEQSEWESERRDSTSEASGTRGGGREGGLPCVLPPHQTALGSSRSPYTQPGACSQEFCSFWNPISPPGVHPKS